MPHPEKNVWGERLNAHLSIVPRFTVGEAVVARCGGPIMLVTDTHCNGDRCDAMWLVRGETRHESFPRDGLRPATWLDRLRTMFGG